MALDYATEARLCRRMVLNMIYKAQSSHIGSNLSIIDVATVLFNVINLDKDLKPDRDRVVWSKGWAAATAYYFLWKKGILSTDDLDTYGKENGLIGLVERSTRGIEATCGSMGHGLPMGVGMALAAKRAKEDWHTYVIMSDGEMDCGTTWESAAIAAHHKLNNLTVIIDCNKWQAMGRTSDILDMASLSRKWDAFNWVPLTCNGHDYTEIALALAHQSNTPKAILADTIKGKGVPEMEDKLIWHYKNIDTDTYTRAIAALT